MPLCVRLIVNPLQRQVNTWNNFLILSTSFFFSEYIRILFIEEFKLYDLAHSGNYEKISEMILGLFLIYPALLVVFIIILIIIQIKLNPNWKEGSYKDLNDMFEKPKDILYDTSFDTENVIFDDE